MARHRDYATKKKPSYLRSKLRFTLAQAWRSPLLSCLPLVRSQPQPHTRKIIIRRWHRAQWSPIRLGLRWWRLATITIPSFNLSLFTNSDSLWTSHELWWHQPLQSMHWQVLVREIRSPGIVGNSGVDTPWRSWSSLLLAKNLGSTEVEMTAGIQQPQQLHGGQHSCE